MSSNSVKPQSSSPPSQPENVKTVGHELNQQITAVRHEDGNESAEPTWTKVVSDRPGRQRRTKDLPARRVENKFSSPPSQPENVKTVGHEIDHKVKQQNTAVRHEDGNVPVDSTWTKVVNDRPARPRRTDLAARIKG